MNRRDLIKKLGIVSAATLTTPLIQNCMDFEWVLEPPVMVFQVNKGEHYYNGPKFIISDENFLRLAVMFPDSQIYNPDEQEYTGWNKVFGMSRKLTEDHQENSARFVSRCDNDEGIISLNLGTYTYNNGNIIKDKIKISLNTNEWYGIGIRDTGKEYKYYFKDFNGNAPNEFYKRFDEKDIIQVDSHKNGSSSIKRWLPPYFGGKSTAPHKMQLHFLNLDYFDK